jgi:arsenate reductase-like glutaredoxin family protein
VGCKKAREFLAQKKQQVEERNLVREPLSVAELSALAAKAGGPEQLVAPKRRAEAAGLSGKALLAWLAEDGGRVRRPIIEVGGKLTLGFTEETRRILDDAL